MFEAHRRFAPNALTLRFCPPDKSEALVLRFSSRPTLLRVSTMSASSNISPLMPYHSFTCSSHERVSQRTLLCGQTAIFLRIEFMSCTMDEPQRMASPEEGAMRPVRSSMEVVLPAPLWPRKLVICDERSESQMGLY